MQESRAQRDISVSKQRLTQSRSVGPSISDAVGAHRFPTDWRLTVRRVGREKRVSLMRSRNWPAWTYLPLPPIKNSPQRRAESLALEPKSQCFVSHILGCAALPIFLDNCPTAAYHGSSSSLERTRVVERSTREPGRSTPAED